MKYILYLFTLTLVFVGGMLVGNFYLPERNTSLAATISVPTLDTSNALLPDISAESASQNLHTIEQALNSCPVIVAEEKQHLINQINMLFALQDFHIKKTAYELEMAKNIEGTRTSSNFSKSASDYAAAKRSTETLAQTLFPAPIPTPLPTPAPELVVEPTEAPQLAEPAPSASPAQATTAPAEANAAESAQ